MMGMADLPTLAEIAAKRAGKPIPKGKTRLEARIEAKPLTTIDEREFKKQVWQRDKHLCRCCERQVKKILGAVPDRGEVNHLHGRTGDLRFEVRAAVLMCLHCHQRYTGKINDRIAVVASATFTIRQGTFTDATYPVRFEKVV